MELGVVGGVWRWFSMSASLAGLPMQTDIIMLHEQEENTEGYFAC